MRRRGGVTCGSPAGSVGAAVAAVAVLSLATWLFSVDSTTASAPDAAPVTSVQPSVSRDLARPPQTDRVAVRHEVTKPVEIVRDRKSDETPETIPAAAMVPRLPQSVDTPASVALPVVAIAEPPQPDAAIANAPAITREETAPLDATPAPSAPEPAAIANETARVRSVLSRYEAAYSALDAQAASSLLPHIDAAALGRAFDSLASQQVSLGDCRVTVTGASARATCAGRTTWVPKVGGGQHTEPRRWTFELRQAGDDWRIVQAVVR